jgi:predicted DNA-binding transcriptional regulator AlpA
MRDQATRGTAPLCAPETRFEVHIKVHIHVPSPVMAEASSELPEDWWTTEDVLAFLRSVGAPISRATWAAYVSRGQAPTADRTFGRSPAWRPAAVRKWQASRPRRGSV